MDQHISPTRAGIEDLGALLAHASPALHPGEFVFITLSDETKAAGLHPLCTFREQEGLTVICGREQADIAGLRYTSTFRQITLTVHSSLEAVGFLAALATALAKVGIPANVVSAYYHDHLFVPTTRAADAMTALSALAQAGAGRGRPSDSRQAS